MGGIMGFSGYFLSLTDTFQQLQKGVMIGAGIVIIVMGISMTGQIPLVRYIWTLDKMNFNTIYSI